MFEVMLFRQEIGHAFNGGSKYSSYPLDLGRPSYDKNSLVMLTNNSKG